MFSSILTASAYGLRIYPVRVEADVSEGLPQFTMVGFLSAQVREAEDRIRSAFRNCEITIPSRRITVNLTPADIPKSGSRFDLPIALAILSSAGIIPSSSLQGVMAAGELSLSGRILPVTGVLPTAVTAREEGCRFLIVPRDNGQEAACIEGLPVLAASSLSELIPLLRHGDAEFTPPAAPSNCALNEYPVDFRDIHGQLLAKRAAAISVAGFHNLLLIGSPGSGKTMIARRIPTILPSLTREESLEISHIYSIAGLLDKEHPLITTRPFRHPHHTITPQALTGGGKIPSPGEVTLAHRGVLFLDEFPEFSSQAVETLRQPLEDREITIARTSGSFRYPANFLLLAAMNPCRCGYFPNQNLCRCTPKDVANYIGRISRPLLDRIDLCVECPPISYGELTGNSEAEISSEEIRHQVEGARLIQLNRFKGTPIHFNSEIPANMISTYCPISGGAERQLKNAYHTYRLSARGYHKILKTARTIADLAGSEVLHEDHVCEALMYRTIDENYWRL